MFPPHFNSQAINNPLTTGLEAGVDLLLRQPYFTEIHLKKKGWVACFTLSGLSGEMIQRSPCHERKDSDSGHVMTYNQIVLQCTFTRNFKVLRRKKKSWLVHSTFQSWFKFPQSRWLRKSLFCVCALTLLWFFCFFFCFAGEWSRHVCQWQGSLFSLTLITSFKNLQSYYSTVCKGVGAITSSMVSRPVMTTGPTKLFW